MFQISWVFEFTAISDGFQFEQNVTMCYPN
jgi:hypothetical protein